MSLIGSNNEEKIWNYFKSKGFNDFGVAGLMGNLKAESGLNSNNLQNTGNKKLGMTDDEYTKAVDKGIYKNFVKDSQGFGIAQWTYWTRKQNLLNYAKSKNKSIGDLEMQLDFLYKELSENYTIIFKTLKSAKSVLEASNSVLLKFEKPADQSTSVQKKRAEYGQVYYDKYAKKETVKNEKKEGNGVAILKTIKTVIANIKNFGGTRSTNKIKYIVIHFTANDGDSDEANAKYFKNNVVKASAHYFVDSDSITQSVKDNRIAYSVGGKKYPSCSSTGGGKYYGKCTNTNNISIELCDDKKNGTIYPSAATIENALQLTRELMKKYNVPKENVIRHFDVVGKLCPGYWCGTTAKNKKWKTEFWDRLDETEKKSETSAKKEETSNSATKKTSSNSNVKEWQKAAIKDGFKLPSGADGIWGKECEAVAKEAVIKKRSTKKNKKTVAVYKYPNLTKIVQKKVGLTGKNVDGMCGTTTHNAIVKYQKKNKLPADGCIGINGWKKILGIK